MSVSFCVAELLLADEQDEPFRAVLLQLEGADARIGDFRRPLRALDQGAGQRHRRGDVAHRGGEVAGRQIRGVRVADQDAVGIVGDPGIALRRRRGVEQDAVDALAGVEPRPAGADSLGNA